jgi:hypothetical protein
MFNQRGGDRCARAPASAGWDEGAPYAPQSQMKDTRPKNSGLALEIFGLIPADPVMVRAVLQAAPAGGGGARGCTPAPGVRRDRGAGAVHYTVTSGRLR